MRRGADDVAGADGGVVGAGVCGVADQDADVLGAGRGREEECKSEETRGHFQNEMVMSWPASTRSLSTEAAMVWTWPSAKR